jgi:hypothetical protein
MVVWYIHRSEISDGARKNTLLGVKKVKISHQSLKTEFEPKNHYGIVLIDQKIFIIELNNEFVVSELNKLKINLPTKKIKTSKRLKKGIF